MELLPVDLATVRVPEQRQGDPDQRERAAADERPPGPEGLTDPADERRPERRATHEDHQVERRHPATHDRLGG
ncbi:hypothetical protein, partial [Aeromicrobium sp. Leaf272]|uniref:hypothetical protein n=1 Tax=Aeromicrobium sp. Leaf272 TaxID=1736317 RepID=UPI00351867B1